MKPYRFILITLITLFLSCLSSKPISQQFITQSSRSSFARSDKNKDNIVTVQQFAHGFNQLFSAGLELKTVMQMIKPSYEIFDKNGDGLSWEEYLEMSITQNNQAEEEDKRQRIDPPELDSI